MMKYIFLAAGGAIGTVFRYSLSGYTYRVTGGIFPWGTLAVNSLGSFLIGALWGLFEIKDLPPQARNFLFIGVLGGFTTFSSFALETMNLFREGELKLAFFNVLVSNMLTLVLVCGGFLLARYLINHMK